MKEHWEHIYRHKSPQEVSWTQEVPETSLQLIRELKLEKNAPIIDIGGGDSKLVDFLIDEGYTDLAVLDISEAAIERAKERLGEKSAAVTWIVSDIRDFRPQKHYSLWHDRAAFHFLTSENDIQRYVRIAGDSAEHCIISTFSTEGPLKCSGLEIMQYDEHTLSTAFSGCFEPASTLRHEHRTPFETTQSFVYIRFSKR